MLDETNGGCTVSLRDHAILLLTGSGRKETTKKAGSRYRLISVSSSATAKRFRTFAVNLTFKKSDM
jgi:hypothetical protein